MSGRSRWAYAVAALCVVAIGSGAVVAGDFVGSELEESTGSTVREQASLPYEQRRQVAPPANGTTVVTVQTFRQNYVVAFAPDGRVRYFEDSLDRYHDVDPAPGGARTVEIVGAAYDGDTTYEVIRRVNLTTGATTDVYRHAVPRGDRPHRWHDADRLDAHRFVVADIRRDAVFVVNATSGERTYEWSAQAAYPLDSGGPYPRDWTHLNDVQRLPDGRYMASLRNQDSVVFITPGEGVDPSWTLGTDDDHAVLHEQHNPDYLPASDGGPAVLVADSQNGRVVEYARVNGTWVRRWTWRDAATAWPRDADRLPNGHTLIGDTNSGRVLEVNEAGEVVWAVDGLPSYDVERLTTGDESTGGAAATRLGLANRSVERPADRPAERLLGLLPNRVRNTVAFIAPLWLSALGRLAAVLGGGATLALLGLAALWRLRAVSERRP